MDVVQVGQDDDALVREVGQDALDTGVDGQGEQERAEWVALLGAGDGAEGAEDGADVGGGV